MTGPTVYVPSDPPEASGFWAFEDQTERLVFVDAHAGSTVYTRWPALDRWHRGLIERGVDWLLNAAGAGRERLDTALRATYPGSRHEATVDRPLQSDFWYRVASPGSLGAQAQMYLGDGVTGSFGGLVIDDAHDETTVTGHAAGDGSGAVGSGGGFHSGENGFGPGGGRTIHQRVHDSSAGGGGGGYAAAGDDGIGNSGTAITSGGPSVPAAWVFEALLDATYTAATLGMGGGGAGGNTRAANSSSGDGGSAGNGLIRVSVTDLAEATDRTLSGSGGGAITGSTGDGGDGGGGSGGLYLAMTPFAHTLATGVTLTLTGGAGGTNARNGGAGANGRVVVLYGDSVDTSAGTITDAELTTYHLLAARPHGGARYI